MKLRLDHIQLTMPEGKEAQARAFWGGLLGLAEIKKPKSLKARGGCWFQLDGAELHIGVEEPFFPAQKAHPCFVITNLASLRALLSGADFPVAEDAPITGRQRFFSKDPFGNRLEFIEFTREADN